MSIPDTVLEEKESPREKLAKLGQIARACAIFGVDVVEVFGDGQGKGESELIVRVLRYLETPQYLRKRLFPLDESLRYAGILPPLRIPSHKQRIPLSELREGDVREGVTNSDGTVEIGLERAPRLKSRDKPGERVTVRVQSKVPLEVEKIDRGSLKEYWGYEVGRVRADEVFSEKFPFTIATSRSGRPLRDALPELRDSIPNSKGVKLIFGSPSRGLLEILGRERLAKAKVLLNLFAEQHVETVRTEEAIFAGLALINDLLAEKA